MKCFVLQHYKSYVHNQLIGKEYIRKLVRVMQVGNKAPILLITEQNLREKITHIELDP